MKIAEVYTHTHACLLTHLFQGCRMSVDVTWCRKMMYNAMQIKYNPAHHDEYQVISYAALNRKILPYSLHTTRNVMCYSSAVICLCVMFAPGSSSQTTYRLSYAVIGGCCWHMNR